MRIIDSLENVVHALHRRPSTASPWSTRIISEPSSQTGSLNRFLYHSFAHVNMRSIIWILTIHINDFQCSCLAIFEASSIIICRLSFCDFETFLHLPIQFSLLTILRSFGGSSLLLSNRQVTDQNHALISCMWCRHWTYYCYYYWAVHVEEHAQWLLLMHDLKRCPNC